MFKFVFLILIVVVLGIFISRSGGIIGRFVRKLAMGGKSKLGILVLTCVVIVFVGFWYIQNDIPDSKEATIDGEIKDVVSGVSDKYQVQHTSIMNGGKDSVIKINVYDKNSVSEVENHLKTNLSGNDLEHYEVDVFYKDEH